MATDDDPIRPTPPGPQAPGLEGVPRSDIAQLETSVPRLMEAAARGPLVLTRHGRDAFVLLPMDVYRRFWLSAPRPPVLDSEAE